MNALADYKLLWNAAVVQWRSSSIVPLVKVLAALLVVIGAGMGLMRHDWMLAMRTGLGIPMLLIQLVWSMIVTPGLALMNTPANARLVPRMRKRMVELTAFGWLLAGAICLLTPFWSATPLIVLWVMSMSGARGGSRIASGLVVVAAMSGTVLKRLPPEIQAFCTSTSGVIIFCALVAAYGAWMIRAVLPNGGDQHFSQRKRQVDTIERFRSLGRKQPDDHRKPTVSPYRFALQRAIRERRPSSLILLGLGPGAHWAAMLPFCGAILVGGFGLHLLFGVERDAASSVAGWVLLLTLVVIVQVGFFTQWKSLLATGRNETALLRLAPRCPSARMWNRSFGAALVRNALAFSVLAIVTTVVLALLDGANRDELVSIGALASTLIVPGIAWMLRDYSLEQQKRTLSWSGKMMRVVPATVAVLAGLIAMLGLQIAIGASAWVLLAVASNLVGALFAVWRWKVMTAAPPAFMA